ncbi:MAG: acyltransferase [Solirubrobacteraceae bacterium]|nr:acyltransferase [Solirubrobacteraceae bacterium]
MSTTTPPTTTAPTWGSRLTGVEGLRAIACTLVLIGHVQWMGHAEPYSAGRFTALLWAFTPTGLILFFVLSGFLLYRPFASSIVLGYAFPEPRRFLVNRFWRIAPAYVAILVAVGLVLGLAVTSADALFVGGSTGQATDMGGAIGRLDDPGLIVANLLLIQNYHPDGVLTGIGPAWTLGVEVAFYLTLPVLAVAAARLGRGRRLRDRVLASLVPAAILLGLGLAGKGLAAATASAGTDPRDQWGQTWHAVLERSFLTWADMFAFGMVAAVVVTLVREGRLQRLQVRHVTRVTVGSATVMLAVLSSVRLPETVQSVLLAAVLAGVVLAVGMPSASPTRSRRALDWRPVVYVGVVSYSVYLWHMPIIGLVRRYDLSLAGRPGFIVTVMMVFTLSVAVAAVTYRYVEGPGLRRKLRPMRAGSVGAGGREAVEEEVRAGQLARIGREV